MKCCIHYVTESVVYNMFKYSTTLYSRTRMQRVNSCYMTFFISYSHVQLFLQFSCLINWISIKVYTSANYHHDSIYQKTCLLFVTLNYVCTSSSSTIILEVVNQPVFAFPSSTSLLWHGPTCTPISILPVWL